MLHEHSGEFDDYMDRIIGVYLDENKCNDEKLKLEEKERLKQDKIKKCQNCLINEECNLGCDFCDSRYEDNRERCLEIKIEHIKKYCNESEIWTKLEEEYISCMDCENRELWYEENIYSIEQMELTE